MMTVHANPTTASQNNSVLSKLTWKSTNMFPQSQHQFELNNTVDNKFIDLESF